MSRLEREVMGREGGGYHATCICKPAEKFFHKQEVHNNENCPYRGLNRVNRWQLKGNTQRGLKNLPLDEEVLFMTMSLFDYTMSPDLIKGWIKKLRPFLQCEDKSNLEFENLVKEV